MSAQIVRPYWSAEFEKVLDDKIYDKEQYRKRLKKVISTTE
jgi:hypothetical protein